MRCGLFGKLPQKRDFVTVAVPRAFLSVWEPWLDAGLAQSRAELGPEWKQIFFEAPIWRFYIGAEICGTRLIGAVMPSVDAVGRCFPLTLVAGVASETEVAEATLAANEAWFAAVEDCLLGTLDPDHGFEATLATLEQIAVPSRKAEGEPDVLYHAAVDLDVAQPLAVLFDAASDSLAATSFWWTRGGTAFPPLAWSHHAMPAQDLYTSMLTGRFPAPAPTS